MIFMHEIYHQPDLDLNKPFRQRKAVRAVIRRENLILLVYAQAADEYKFPGGGIQYPETDEQALIREVNEEVGGTVTRINEKLGTVIEYAQSKERADTLFKMTSDYYVVDIDRTLQPQKLDEYEKNLQFIPQWVTIAYAENVNKENIRRNSKMTTPWIQRETYVLSQLQDLLK